MALLQRKTNIMILRICKNCTLCPALLLKGLSSHCQDSAFPLPFKCSSFYHWILYLLRSMGFHIWGQILFCSFPGRISPCWEAPDSWVISSKQAALIFSRMDTTALPRNQLLSTSAAHFCVTGVSAFGQEYLGPKAAHCQIQQSRGFYLQCHYFLFLCVCTVN